MSYTIEGKGKGAEEVVKTSVRWHHISSSIAWICVTSVVCMAIWRCG